MPEDSQSSSNLEIGQRIQEKFDAYLLGLIFTILALSIQTADFGQLLIADICEIVGWFSLLAAGLIGLSRLERTPNLYRLYGEQDNRTLYLSALKKARLEGVERLYVLQKGKEAHVNEIISELEDAIAKLDKAIKPLERRGVTRYRAMKIAFVVGLTALMLARTLGPLLTNY